MFSFRLVSGEDESQQSADSVFSTLHDLEPYMTVNRRS